MDLLLYTMKVPYVPEGLEAIIFTADGDMRQALNNLQATYSGFRFVNQENVFKVYKSKMHWLSILFFCMYYVHWTMMSVFGFRFVISLIHCM